MTRKSQSIDMFPALTEEDTQPIDADPSLSADAIETAEEHFETPASEETDIGQTPAAVTSSVKSSPKPPTALKSMNENNPVHPGQRLKRDYLDNNALSISQAARDMDMPANRLAAIVNGDRSITANTAIRLSIYFGMPAHFWMDLQKEYDLMLEKSKNYADLKKRVRPFEG